MKRRPKQATATPVYVRPTVELRALLDERVKEERRTYQAVVLAALWAYLDPGREART